MKISKHNHSCLLVHEENITILIDPGNYTYDSKALDINVIDHLDYVLITHEHPDHMSIPLIKNVMDKFPEAKIISNSSVVKILESANIQASTEQNEFIKMEEVPHEKVFGVNLPQNVKFDIFNKLTHPGDSLHFSLSTPILALPVQAPWCSLTQAVEKALELKPKVIIPIHDWHWSYTARGAFYIRLEDYFKQFNIEFKSVQTGEIIEI